MTRSKDEYEAMLDASSSARRYDPLRDAANEAVLAWMAEDEQEKNDLSERFWHAMSNLAGVLVARKSGEPEQVMSDGAHGHDVPDVEVTYDTHPVHVEVAEGPVVARRSAAKNVSDPIYQNAFISEARRSMGQPSVQDAEALLGYPVTLTFNVDKAPVGGMLTDVIQHPASAAYLVLDNNRNLLYPLNSVQDIVKVR